MNFILDSGATDQLIYDEMQFIEHIDLKSPIKIAVAKQGEFIYATKRGIVRLQNENQITLEDVPYCRKI